MLDEGALKDFVKVCDVDEELIQEYRERLPEEMITVWEKYGFGTFMDGYLKVINPNDYKQLLEDSYFLGNVSIPIIVTAFGDVIAWRSKGTANVSEGYVDIVFYRYGTNDIMIPDLDLFFMLLSKDPTFAPHFFAIDKYSEAVEMHGPLAYDQCFGYVPILAIGGKEAAENLKKVKTREHIAVITALAGGI